MPHTPYTAYHITICWHCRLQRWNDYTNGLQLAIIRPSSKKTPITIPRTTDVTYKINVTMTSYNNTGTCNRTTGNILRNSCDRYNELHEKVHNSPSANKPVRRKIEPSSSIHPSVFVWSIYMDGLEVSRMSCFKTMQYRVCRAASLFYYHPQSLRLRACTSTRSDPCSQHNRTNNLSVNFMTHQRM